MTLNDAPVSNPLSRPVSATFDAEQLDVLTDSVTRFLYREAGLLDDWRLDDWLELMDPEVSYRVPAWEFEDGDPRTTMQVVNDDWQLLRGRATRLKSKHAHAESPKSHTTRQVTNVHVVEHAGDMVEVRSAFFTLRYRLGQADHFVGSYRHRLRLTDPTDPRSDLRIVERVARLGHPVIDAGGTVSIVL
jgi:p-cumate 2,3-dioxygenase beta subunit